MLGLSLQANQILASMEWANRKDRIEKCLSLSNVYKRHQPQPEFLISEEIMIFEEAKFRQFLWREYGDDYWGSKSIPCPDEVPQFESCNFDQWIERNVTAFKMVGHLCEFLAELKAGEL